MSNRKVKARWDEVWVHGRHPDTDYIGRRTGKENTDALIKAAPYLKEAFAKRKAKHDKHLSLLKQMVQLLSQLVTLLSRRS